MLRNLLVFASLALLALAVIVSLQSEDDQTNYKLSTEVEETNLEQITLFCPVNPGPSGECT